MRYIANLLIVIVSLCLFFVQETQPSYADDSPSLIPPDFVILDDLYNRTNILRQKRDVAPLLRNVLLDKAAQNQAEWLVTTGIRTHYRPDGSKPSTRAREVGYNYKWCCGENYYMSIDATPDMVWDFWLWSHDHYVNLINRSFDDIGLGMSSNGARHSYVIVFGDAPDDDEAITPQSPLPEPTSAPTDILISAPVSNNLPLAHNGGYTVRPGDTLFRIATSNGTTVETMMVANNLNDPTLIYPGQQLDVPDSDIVESDSMTEVDNTVIAFALEDNWCNPGQPWGDGRCIIPDDPFTQDFMWKCGWYRAQNIRYDGC